jgi:nitrate/TMAO reductase-like tetraheme cytochrome c subunit
MPDDRTGADSAPAAPVPAGGPGQTMRPSGWSRFATRVRASRWLMAGTVVVALLVVFGLFLAGMTVFNWTESTAFCSSCHVMHPELTAYQNSPHARVDCGSCHIGPGALPAVQAKLASLRYLWEYPTGNYPKPIPSPITSLRPVEVVCEQCHWPQKFYDNRLVRLSSYAPDEKNSLTRTALEVKTGGGQASQGQGRGIHWHIDNPVYYIAADEKRQDIPWVQAQYNGVTTEYLSTDSTLTPEQIAKAEKRKMDCVDCHNRATHIFQNPNDAIDGAMASGNIPADLPWIKKEAAAVLGATYTTRDEAVKAINAVEETYKTQYPDVYATRQADVKKSVAALTAILDQTQFPDMKTNWETHANNIGHKDSPGCFRCHDGKHLSKDNQAVRLECNLCHSIPLVAGPGQQPQPIPVATVAEPDTHKSTTWMSEHRFKFDESCAACHDVKNPGGTDNSSFCSNSACHGGEWKYVGLNAPKVRALSAPAPAPSTGQPKPVPHPIAAGTDCKVCHAEGKVHPFPANHASYTIDICTSCHQPALPAAGVEAGTTPTTQATSAPAPAATESAPATQAAPSSSAPAIPHDVAGREKCLTCHNPNGGLKPAPPDHANRTEDTCQVCHKPASAGAGTAATPEATAGATAEATAQATAQPTVEATAQPTAEATAQPTAEATAQPLATTTVAPAQPAAPAAGAAPAIPHAVAGRENCLLCHDPNGGRRPAPPDHAGRSAETCQGCHKPA